MSKRLAMSEREKNVCNTKSLKYRVVRTQGLKSFNKYLKIWFVNNVLDCYHEFNMSNL